MGIHVGPRHDPVVRDEQPVCVDLPACMDTPLVSQLHASRLDLPTEHHDHEHTSRIIVVCLFNRQGGLV